METATCLARRWKVSRSLGLGLTFIAARNTTNHARSDRAGFRFFAMHRTFVFALGSSFLIACSPASTGAEPREDAQIMLSHSWNVSPETSKFYAVDMGTEPPEAADALMGTLPTVMHKIGADCAAAEWTGNGELVIALHVEGGAPKDVAVAPEISAAACLVEAVEAQAGQFEGLPDASVLVRANYMVPDGS